MLYEYELGIGTFYYWNEADNVDDDDENYTRKNLKFCKMIKKCNSEFLHCIRHYNIILKITKFIIFIIISN